MGLWLPTVILTPSAPEPGVGIKRVSTRPSPRTELGPRRGWGNAGTFTGGIYIIVGVPDLSQKGRR